MTERVLVTGADGGIGRQVAAALIDAGYAVTGTVLNEEQARSLREGLPRIAATPIIDLSDSAKAKPLLEDAIRGETPLAAVVGCAGFATFDPIETTDIASLRTLFEVNTFANVALYQASLPALRLTKGRFVVLSSYTGRLSFPLFSQYSASKHALEAFMNVARLEAGQWDIGVSLVVPGGVKTPMTDNLSAKLEARLNQLPPVHQEQYRDLFQQYSALMAASLDSFSEPETVAAAVLAAITDATPKPRYVVGADAEALIGQKNTLSEEDFDKFISSMLPGRRKD